MIEVCCALIQNKSRILAVQRGRQSSHPELWEFPGGKIQFGETAQQCIIREIKEELSIGIEITQQLDPVDFDYGDMQIRLIPFVCSIKSGRITLTEHIGKQWITSKKWEDINWSGADRKLLVKNQEKLKSILPDWGR